jgi:MFS family permease
LLSVLVAASGAFAAAGYLGGGWLSDRTGRRTIGTMLSLLAAIFAAGAFAVGVGGFWAGNLGASLLAGASTPVVAAWLAELFPTRARVTAESAAGIAGAAGGVAGLQVVGLLTPNLGFGRVFTGLGIAGAAGALLLLLLPETRGAKLAD